MVKHRHRQASNHSPCATCNGAPPLLRRQHLPAPDSNPCFSAGDDLFLTGSATSRTPVSLRVADGQSQSPRPAMSFPHPLPSAPSRLPRLSPLTIPALPLALSVQLPVPVPRTLRCAVRYVSTCLPHPSPPRQVGNLPGYVPYLSPACHLVPLTQSRRIFHPMALLSPSTVAARSCLVSSRLVCPPTQWHPALFVAGSPLSGHGSVMGDGGCGCRRGRASFRRVLHAPPPPPPGACHEKERSAILWPGTVMSPHWKCPGSSDSLCRVPAAHFLVISAVPCLPASTCADQAGVRPSSLQPEVIIADYPDPRTQDPSWIWLLPHPVISHDFAKESPHVSVLEYAYHAAYPVSH